MEAHVFEPFKNVPYPCYWLDAHGNFEMNQAAQQAEGVTLLSAEVRKQMVLAQRKYEMDDTDAKNAVFGSVGKEKIQLLPLEQGILAVSSGQPEYPTERLGSLMRQSLDGIFSVMPLLSKEVADERQVLVEDLQKNSYYLLRVTDNLEKAGRLQNGDFRRVPVDLQALVESISSAAVDLCLDLSVLITSNIGEIPLVVQADPGLLEAALLNVLRNSLQYSRERNRVRIGLRRTGQQAIITVEDEGMGIRPEVLPRIFEPYFSEEPYGDSYELPGLGLGLWIAQQTFLNFGGNIVAESRFGEGTRISMSLPLYESMDGFLASSKTDYLLNRYSPVYLQLCGYCRLPSPR